MKRFSGLETLGVPRVEPDFGAAGRLRASAPLRADQSLRIEVDQDVFVEITGSDLGASLGQRVEEAWVFPDARPGLDVVQVTTDTRVEELRLVRDVEMARETRYRLRLGPGITSVRARERRVELLDREGRVRLASEPAFAIDAKGQRRALTVRVDGDRVTFALDTEGLEAPIAVDPAWTTTASISVSRQLAQAVTLKSGKVLLAGGSTTDVPIGAPELYDPATKTWTAAGTMISPRRNFTMIGLDDGRVLAVGGAVDASDAPTSSAEIYNPTTNTWSAAASLANGRRDIASVLLPSKKVIIVGGTLYTGTATTPRELPIYDPGTNTWGKSSALLAVARIDPSAVSLQSGRVFIIGGREGGSVPKLVEEPELYDPSTDTIKKLTRPPTSRIFAYVAEITAGTKKGKIIQIGGSGDPDGAGDAFANATIYDLATDTWSAAASMSTKREFFNGFAMGSKFLVAGGLASLTTTGATVNDTSELYDPETDKWTDAGKLSVARGFAAQALLADGSALVIGGTVKFDGTFFTSTNVTDRFALVADGGTCVAAGECSSGSCVEGHCCKSSSCAPYACTSGTCATSCTATADCAKGSYCDTTTKACVAQKTTGTACGGVDECSSGNCVDGYCCGSACTEQCAACDVVGHLGECFAVKGVAHGSRTPCMTDTANVCASSVCDGLDKTRCAGVPGTETTCRTASCVDGVATAAATCSASACPAAVSTSCLGYKCDTTACKTKCTTNDDCAGDYACNSGACVPKTSSCASDTQMLTSDGNTVECAPYVCRDRACLGKCTSSADCIAGSACESGACTAPVPETDSGGGCAMNRGRRATAAGSFLVLVLGLAAAARRRKSLST
ncbi:MAG: kelch repeat-containing protein [Polyangiales bacterium]